MLLESNKNKIHIFMDRNLIPKKLFLKMAIILNKNDHNVLLPQVV